MVANWSLADLMVSFPGYAFPFDIGTIGLTTSGNCNLRFGGAAYVCHLTNDHRPSSTRRRCRGRT